MADRNSAALGAMLAMQELPPWLGWAPDWLIVVAAALAAFLEEWAARWLTRRRAEADAEEEAVKKLREHLGRQKTLARLGKRTATALDLRVHPAIPLDPEKAGPDGTAGLDPDLPTFIGRGVLEDEVRRWMRNAATEGGFLVLVGDSSVGKTRLLYHLAREQLGDFPVLLPDLGVGDGELINTVAKPTFPLPKLLVWLDELQRFLESPTWQTTRPRSPRRPSAICSARPARWCWSGRCGRSTPWSCGPPTLTRRAEPPARATHPASTSSAIHGCAK